MTWHGLIGNALSVTFFVTAMLLYLKDPPSPRESRAAKWIVSFVATCALIAFTMFAGTAMLIGAKEVLPYVKMSRIWR